MKKSIILLAALLCGATYNTYAQERKVEQTVRMDTLNVEYKTRYISNSFWDNFYLQGSFAGHMLLSSEDTGLSFGKRIKPGFSLAIGKQFHPDFGVRLSFGGMRLDGWNNGATGLYAYDDGWVENFDPVEEYWKAQGVDTQNGYKQEIRYFEVNADFMFDLYNIFTRNNRWNRRWTAEGYVGIGYLRATKYHGMEDNNKDYGRSEGLSYTLKGVLRPMYKSKNGALHIGAAFSYRNPKTTNTDGYAVARYSSRNSTNINRKKYLDTDDMPGMDHEIAWTVELAGHWKGLRYETAYLARTAYFDPTVNDIVPQKADGWYAQAGILLFGGRQNYDADGAKYTRVTRGRSWGDLELCARYEYCNFNTANYFGGSAEAYTLGLNWYATNNVKIVLNYQFNNNDRYANGKGKLLVGHDAAGNPTSDYTKVVESDGKAGVDYHMIALRFEVAF